MSEKQKSFAINGERDQPLLPASTSEKEPVPAASEQNQSSNLSVVPVFFLCLVACFCYNMMQVLIKDLQINDGVSVCEINFLRSFCSFFIAIGLLCVTRENILASAKRDNALPLLTRCLIGSIAFITVTKCVELLPITMFMVMTNLTLFASGLMAYCWLGERLSPFIVVAMIIAFGGIVLVTLAKPQINDTDEEAKVFDDYTFGIILGACIVFIFAICAVTTRKIRDLHFSVIMFYICLISILISSVWLLFYRRTNEVFQFGGDWKIWLKIFGASFCHFTAEMCTTCANQSVNPATVGMFMYSQLVMAYLADVFIFDSQFTALQFLGAAIIISCSVATAIYKRLVLDKANPKREKVEVAKENTQVGDPAEDGEYKRV